MMQDYQIQKAQIYTDFTGLNALKFRADEDKKAALEEVARQFEALFLSEMLKSMRKAGDVFSEGNMLNSERSGFYRDMFDNQLSLTMAENKGLGLADVLIRQLSQQIPGMDHGDEARVGHKARIADYDRSLPPLSFKLPEQVQQVEAVALKVTSAPSTPADMSKALPEEFESPEHFVRELLPVAKRVASASGIDPKLMIAQAALETGWGRHMIKGDGGKPSFNLFGIKADSRWQGNIARITTTEYREGVPMKEQADFRAYSDYESSFRDYIAFLESNPRYQEVLSVADQPDVFAEKLQQAGYATDPNYGDKIRKIMNRDSLMTLSLDTNGAKE